MSFVGPVARFMGLVVAFIAIGRITENPDPYLIGMLFVAIGATFGWKDTK